MQLNKAIGGSLAAATCSLLGALPTASVAAEETPRWQFDTALLYWGESDGRVQDASVRAAIRRAIDEDRALSATVTVDALTGASPSGAVPSAGIQTFTRPSGEGSYRIAPGTTPLDDSFKDTRAAVTVNWQAPLGEAMRWNAGLSASHEFDYLHLGVNARLERDLNLRNTTLYGGLAWGSDRIDAVGGAPLPLSAMLAAGNLANKQRAKTKDVADLLLGVTQVLSRRSLLEVSYSYGRADGYLNDPYKILSVVDPVSGAPSLYRYESRPDSRAKHSLFAEWRHAFDRDSLALNYRVMKDDWGVLSHTLEARYRWNQRHGSYLEPHVRFYQQGAADFYRTALFAGAPLPSYASADYRLAENSAITVGAKYARPMSGGEFSVRLEYYHQTAKASAGVAVGSLAGYDLVPPLNAVIAQFGYRFDY